MTQTEIAILLVLANGHDQRQGIDDVRVQAWWDLLNQEAPDMPFEFGKETVNRHYALVTGMIMPAHLVTAWKNHKARRRGAIPHKAGVPMPEWFREKVKGNTWE